MASYTVSFNTNDPQNISQIASGYESITFRNIDWDRILPLGVEQFFLTTTFANNSYNTTQYFDANKLLTLSLTTTNNVDQSGSSSVIFNTLSATSQAPLAFYRSTLKSENKNKVIVNRPVNSSLTVQLLNFDGTLAYLAGLSNYGYVLTLNFIPYKPEPI